MKRAEVAVRAGDDALAKEALRRKGEKEAERAETQKALQEQGVYGDQLTAALKALDARLKDIKLRQGTLRAKARANEGGGAAVGQDVRVRRLRPDGQQDRHRRGGGQPGRGAGRADRRIGRRPSAS